MERSRVLGAVLAVAALGTVAAGCSGTVVSSDSERACAGPSLTVEPATAAPGDTVTVTGENLISGCADVSGVQGGGRVVAHETEAPLGVIEIDLVLAGDERVTLASVAPDDDGRFTVEVTLPGGLAGAESALLDARGAHADVVVALAP